MSDAKRLLTTIPSKVAAGVLGALLAGSLGAGAMTGTISLASDESDVTDDAAVLAEQQEEAEEAEADALFVEEGDDAGEDEPKAPVDPMVAPTSVSEAAQNHHFDEACGNHGAYVSHFARTGEEPQCALDARAALADAAETPAIEGEADAEDTEVEETGPGKSDQGKAKAAAAKAKAAERKAAGAKGRSGR